MTVDLHKIIPCALGIIASPLFLALPFSRRYRDAPRWLRAGFLLAAPLVLAWGITGVYLAVHETNHHNDLPFTQFWFLHCTHLTVGGMGLGVLITLVISPEFYRRHDRTANV
jgi:hypothetical protein